MLTAMIDEMRAGDWPAVRAIYLEGIATGNATFETDAPPWDVWDGKHLARPRIVFRDDDRVAGWAALTRVSARACYSGVAEVSVYIGGAFRGRGIGSKLLRALIEQSEADGIWTLQASIFPENEASVQIHLRHGFRVVGRRERIARLHDVWRDTLLLERRSAVL
jgi:L-amino acid N-acyltransferase YncA